MTGILVIVGYVKFNLYSIPRIVKFEWFSFSMLFITVLDAPNLRETGAKYREQLFMISMSREDRAHGMITSAGLLPTSFR